jgi:hypothetical protein
MSERILITIHLPMDMMEFAQILESTSKIFPGCYVRNNNLTGFPEIYQATKKEEPADA